jgi:outer membrane protein assembly factor BamD (BamD/ComL family)
LLVLLVLAGPAALSLRAAGPDPDDASAGPSSNAFIARRLYQRAEDLLEMGEADRAIKMFETIISQHPRTLAKYEALLAIGKHHARSGRHLKAIELLKRIKPLAQTHKGLSGKRLEIYLESLYLAGVGQFHMKDYTAAFPILRKITRDYPNSVWANQAYYYIGLCHFAQSNWSKAIDALSLVGTFVDPDSPSVDYVEAGRRFYVKIEDADLPVLYRLGKTARLEIQTSRGDREIIECIPLSMQQAIFLASVPTEIALPRADDGKLQVSGGDAIEARYADANTRQGRKDVLRQARVKVVSTGSVQFTTGTYESPAVAAFVGQPLFVVVRDADLDTSARSDAAEVTLEVRYRVETDRADDVVDAQLGLGEQQQYRTRDQLTVQLTELGRGEAIHSGRFAGKVLLEPITMDAPADTTDRILSAALNDEILVTYSDARHIQGEAVRDVQARIVAAGEIDAAPRATQPIVSDPTLRAQVRLVEAEAFLELARIFRSMGLNDGGDEKARQGLDRIEQVLGIETPIAATYREQAWKLKWQLQMVQEDFAGAITTCKLFHALYPDSPFVDQAMVSVGKIRFEDKQYKEAIEVFEAILALPNSHAKAEAQYMIARCLDVGIRPEDVETAAGARKREAAIRAYKRCAEKYPDSEFAGPSLAELVDYYIRTRDFVRANDLLEQIFQDYPDAAFLDAMLLKWTQVAYLNREYRKAYEKCTQLIFEYPDSQYIDQAKRILPSLQRIVKGQNDSENEQ